MKFKLPNFLVSNKRQNIKKVIFSIFLFVILISVSTSSFAQAVNKFIDNVTMDDPSVAALQKYSDVPVSYSSGVPNINIPIFNVQEGELSLPISLSYHASGIRVVEPASRVGLGWSLNAGGVVSRTIVGKPDEGDRTCQGYWRHGKDIELQAFFSPASPSFFPPELNIFEAGCSSGDICFAAKGQIDSEPDIFSFNFGNYSGKFWITPLDEFGEQEVVVIPEQDIKIEKVEKSVDYLFGDFFFKITTPDGNQYLFGESPTTDNSVALHYPLSDLRSVSVNDEPHPTNWFLSRIVSSDKQSEIKLSYTKERYSYTIPPDKTHLIALYTNQVSPSQLAPSTSFPTNIPLKELTMDIFGVRLSKIENSTGTQIVEFNATKLRKDLINETTSHRFNNFWGRRGTCELNSIEINQGNFCKTFEFNYDYFEDNSIYKKNKDERDKRLKLNSIQEIGCDGAAKPSYEFHYFENYSQTNFLPNRFTKAVDHWGFYNGADLNNNQHPSSLNIPTINNGFVSFNSQYELTCETNKIIDRETNEDKMKLGTLERVVFPEGGFHQYDLEANDYYGSFETYGGVAARVNALCPQAESAYSSKSVTFPSVDIFNDHKYKLNVYIFDGPTTSFNINVVDAQNYDIVYSENTIEVSPSTIANNLDCGFLGDLIDFSNIPFNTPVVFEISSDNANCYDVALSFVVREPCLSNIGNRKVGGLRIKNSIVHDGISKQNDIIKSYTYKSIEDDSKSSGDLFQTPNYRFSFPLNYNGQTGKIYFENNRMPLNSFEGRHISYSHVKESIEGNGYSLYEFHTEQNNQFPTIYPLRPTEFFAEANKQKEIERVSESGILISKEESIPKYDAYKYSGEIMFKVKLHTVQFENEPDAVGNLLFTTLYDNRTRPYRIKQKINVLDGVETVTDYEFDSSFNKLAPTAITVKNSDGKNHRTTYLYGDTDSCLSDHGMTGILLEERNYVDGALVGGTGTDYSNFTFNGTSACKPVSSYQIGESGQKYTRFSILDYTDDGLPFKVQTNGYPIEELTWQNRLLTKREWGNHKEEWLYWDDNQTRLLMEKIDIDDLTTKYEFDEFFRLKNISSRDGKISTDYDYYYHNSEQVPNFGLAINHISTSTIYEGAEEQKTTEVLDGLGRPIQNIQCAYSPDGKDVRQSTSYDNIGRPFKNYQVIEAGNTCSYLGSTGTDVWETTYEKNPLNRPIFNKLSSWPAGVGTMYGCNSLSDLVKIYEEGCGNNASGIYPNCSLNKATNVDENGNLIEVYTDKIGRQVLERKFVGKNYMAPMSNQGDMDASVQISLSGSKNVDTYYVYGDKGNVVLVISPESADGSLGDLNYCYTYDDRNRMVLKDLPGSGPMTMDYYDSDLLKWETDANGNTINYVYDEYGRLSKKYLNGSIDDDGNVSGGDLIMKDEYFEENGTNAFKSQLKSTGAAIITGDNVVGPLLTTEFKEFDEYARVKNTISTNNVGGEDIVTYVYADHADNIDNINRLHQGYETVDLTEHFSYDHSFRNISHSLNSNFAGESQLSSSSYTYKDELKSKTVGGTSLDYVYNTRSWLTNINSIGSSLPFNEDLVCVPGIPIVIDLDITPFNPCDHSDPELPDVPIVVSESNVSCVFVDCDSLPLCNTSEFGYRDPEVVIQEFLEFISTVDAVEMGVPQNLYRIRLCDGQETYITDSGILLAQINGIEIPAYIILQVIPINGIAQAISMEDENGVTSIVPFYELVNLLNSGQVPIVESYPVCGEEITCNHIETLPLKTNVTSSVENAYCTIDLETFNFDNGGVCGEELLLIEGDCSVRYSHYTFEFEPFSSECNSMHIDSVVLNLGGLNVTHASGPYCRDSVYSVSINGEFYEFPENRIVLNEPVSTLGISLSTRECTYCLTDLSQQVFYSCDCSTEDPPKEPNDCTCTPIPPKPIDDPEPCLETWPNCSDEEFVAQDLYIRALMHWAENITAGQIDFPIEICRTTLCDGRRISIPLQYLETHPLPGPYECESGISPQEPPNDCELTNFIFAMNFSYESPNGSYSGATPQYNGNISQIEQQIMYKHVEGINYEYDQLDRLKRQDYWWKSCHQQYWNNKFYNVENIQYDLNGNMESILRHTRPLDACDINSGVIDILAMGYDGNQLVSVADGATIDPPQGYIMAEQQVGYTYDANGNMATIANKNMSIGYNFLNLPSIKGFAAEGGTGSPAWTYTADGQKLKYENREYVDGIEYKDGKLYAIHHAEGRIFPKEQTQDEINNNAPLEWQYQFNIKDHLGNTRIVIDDSGLPIQENNYYPFGMNMENIDIVDDKGERDTRFTYNGKEMNEDLGWHDYGARFYDPAIARWNSVDPLAELAPGWTPYRYGFNNPVLYTDPFGLFETRREARRYRRQQRRAARKSGGSFVFNKIVKNKKSGRFQLHTKESTGFVTRAESGELDYGATGFRTELTAREPNTAEKIRDFNFITSMLFNMADDAAVTAQSFNSFQTQVRRLNGDFTDKNERTNAFVNTGLTAVPIGKITALKSFATHKVSSIFKRLSAPQFSVKFKGTFAARAHPKVRGLLNRAYNMAAGQANSTIPSQVVKQPITQGNNLVNGSDN